MYRIVIDDALTALKKLESNSVDCCITSPPYYGLRDYGADGQIGLEETPSEYIEKLVDVFREVKRVLKKDGTLWLNIGDSYAGSGKGRNADGTAYQDRSIFGIRNSKMGGTIKNSNHTEYKRKDMMGIPWKLAFALQSDGWYLRQDIIWYKPNCMPESVKDRCTKSHEYIFLLSKSDKYHFDNEAIKEPAVTSDRTYPRGSKGTKSPNSGRRKQDDLNLSRYKRFNERYFSKGSPLKRNKRDVWSVSTQGYKGAHFATFPEKLIEPCVLAGCPMGGIVLDPFLGSGTTAIVAIKNKRNCIGIEINQAYADMAIKRIRREESV